MGWLESKTSEGSFSQAEVAELREPLKHIQVPPYPGEEALVRLGAARRLAWRRDSATAAAYRPTLPMSNKLRVTLSEPIAAEVRRISAILGLSPDKTAQYLIKCCLKLYHDAGGDTMRLIGLAEGINYHTREQAQAVAERLEAEAALNHLEDPEQERLISVEVLEKGDGWKFKIDHLCGGKWKDIDALEREPPPFQ